MPTAGQRWSMALLTCTTAAVGRGAGARAQTSFCADAAASGYQDQWRQPLSCVQMVSYCNRTGFAQNLRKSCPKSCKLCSPGAPAVEHELPACLPNKDGR